MSDLEKRVEKLEKSTEASEIFAIMIYDGDPEPTKEQVEAAKAEYKARNPDWEKEEKLKVLFWKGDHFATS